MYSGRCKVKGDDASLTAYASVEDEVHNEMMKTCLNELKKRGFINLKAVFENMPQPEQIDDYMPDFTFNKKDKPSIFVIFEVETCSSIMSKDTDKKWKIFYERAKASDGEFHLAVPKFCNGDSGRILANQKLQELNIEADLVWAVNGSLRCKGADVPTHDEGR